MKIVQYFTPEYLDHCRKLSTAEILEFLEEFRLIHSGSTKSKLISIKIPENLLSAFKLKAKAHGIPYQSQIKLLMNKWLTEE